MSMSDGFGQYTTQMGACQILRVPEWLGLANGLGLRSTSGHAGRRWQERRPERRLATRGLAERNAASAICVQI